MRVDFDVPSHILNYNRDYGILAAAISLVAAVLIGFGFYFFESGDPAVVFGSVISFLVLQPTLHAVLLYYVPTKQEMHSIGMWIRLYGPELHQRLLEDIRTSGEGIGSPHLVTYFEKIVLSDLTEPQLTWAIDSELYSLREIALLRLMRTYMGLYGHLVGSQEVIHGYYVGTMPYYAVSQADIEKCSL